MCLMGQNRDLHIACVEERRDKGGGGNLETVPLTEGKEIFKRRYRGCGVFIQYMGKRRESGGIFNKGEGGHL